MDNRNASTASENAMLEEHTRLTHQSRCLFEESRVDAISALNCISNSKSAAANLPDDI